MSIEQLKSTQVIVSILLPFFTMLGTFIGFYWLGRKTKSEEKSVSAAEMRSLNERQSATIDGLYSKLTALDRKFEEAETEHSRNLRSVTKDYDKNMEEFLASHKLERTKTDTRIATLEATNLKLEEQLATAQATITTMGGQLTTAQETILAMGGQIKTLIDQLELAHKKVENSSAAPATPAVSADSAITVLREAVVTLEVKSDEPKAP